MEFIARAKAILATLRSDNRGLVRKVEEVVDELRDIAPKLEDEYKALEAAGVFRGMNVTIDPSDNLPFPNSLLADFVRARTHIARLLAGDAEPAGEVPAAEPAAAPDAAAPEATPAAPDAAK